MKVDFKQELKDHKGEPINNADPEGETKPWTLADLADLAGLRKIKGRTAFGEFGYVFHGGFLRISQDILGYLRISQDILGYLKIVLRYLGYLGIS